MKSMTTFLCSSSRRLFIRTTQTPPINSGIIYFSTSSSDSSSYHSSSRRNPDDVRNVRVSVWWDFENCQIPCNVNVYKLTHAITCAVRANGIKGPIQITAFGDILQLSRSNQEALSSTGINLTHIPNGGKNSADRSLLVDLMYWVSQNPPPAHIFLISGDRDFANILHRLRMNNYNVLLASKDNASAVLCSAATIMWQWNSLARGENLTGKHFNQPPDGPYASWYAHYRGPLQDPYAEEVSDSNSEPNVRPIPNAVVNVIRNILKSYPKGLSITQLRAELGKSDINIEKDLYGHKKFSRFLMAMPSLLRLQSEKDGQYIIHGVTSKDSVPVVHFMEATSVPVREEISSKLNVAKVSMEDHGIGGHKEISSKLNVAKVSMEDHGIGGHNTSGPTREEISLSSSKLNVSEPSSDLEEKEKEPSLIEKAKEGEVAVKKAKPDEGIFKSIWWKWFGGNEVSTSQNITGIVNADVKSLESEDKGIQDAEVVKKHGDNVSKAHGVINQIVRWCKFWQSDKNSENPFSNSDDKDTSSHSELQEVFTESFWKDMSAFLDTSKGSISILQSNTRQEMAQNLQRFGPFQLKSLTEKHILHLVELLISEKKWVVETPSQKTLPFKLTKQSTNKNRQECSNSNMTKGLVSPRMRKQIFSHCQKLVNEVVREYPNGYNMNNFKKLFLDRYGYHLEVQLLGYQKLATALQMMPGVKLESNYILPSDKSRIMEEDSEWEELGPMNDNTKKDDFERKHTTEKDSSLLQILDSWYGNKEDMKNMDCKKKGKPLKRYAFVAEKQKPLINEIMGSLKKPGNGSKIEG